MKSLERKAGSCRIRLAIRGLFGESGEFKNVLIAQERDDRGGRALRASSAGDGFLVRREAGTNLPSRSIGLSGRWRQIESMKHH